MGQTLLFAATFLPSFLLGRVSGERLRQNMAGLLPDTFGGLVYFLAIVVFMAMTVDGVIGRLVPDYLHQPITFLMTGFGSGTFLAVVRGLFRPVPEAPPAVIGDKPRYRASSAIPPDEFWTVQR